MRTSFVCPMRCARAIACTSFCGFQSESKMMTVSAAVRLMPWPPALVDSRKANTSEPGLLKRSMAACRSLPRMEPSRRSNLYALAVSSSSSSDSIILNCENSSTRWPSSISLGSSLSSSTILPDAATMLATCSPRSWMSPVSRSSAPRSRKGWLQHLRSSISMFTRLATEEEVTPRDRKVRLRSKMAR